MKKFSFPIPEVVRRSLALCLLAGLLAPASAQTPDAAAPAPAAAAATARTLTGLDVVSLEGGRVQIILTLSDTAPEPVIFTVDKPARLSLDLPDTKLALGERFKRINAGKARSVAAAEAQGRTRVVVELASLVPYNVRTDGNKVFVEIQGTSSMAAAAPVVGGIRTVAGQILAVDFRRGEKGEGRVVVKLADPRTVVDVKEEGGRVLAQFRNTDAPEAVFRRLDVLDFATPVKFVDVIRDGRNVNLVLTPIAGADFEQVAYQAGDQFTVELQPLTKEAEAGKRKEQQFSGERISLSFQNIDVRSLLQIIGDVSGNNVVISDGVKGELAMRLQNVPWDQALDIILKTKGLGLQQQGNVMLIAPLDEMAARAKAEGEAIKQKDEGAPLRNEIIQVNYAKAQDIADLLRSATNSMLTARGKVSVDARTNSLLVQETREKLADIRLLVTRLDIPVRQVLIESRIVIANEDFTKALGTRFGVQHFNTINGQVIGTTGTSNDTRTLLNDVLDGSPTFTFPGTFNVNLPAAGAAGSIGAVLLGRDYVVDLELSALQAEGRGEVISTPRVITANAKQATIKQGVQIPYQQATSSGATSVQFKDAVLALDVTPQITPDDRILMDLKVQDDSRGQDVSSGTAGTIPSIDTRSVITQVLVRTGETVVLGGIYDQTRTHSVTKVPLLGDLPLLGYLFRSTNEVNNKKELLVFVTPKILNEGIRVP